MPAALSAAAVSSVSSFGAAPSSSVRNEVARSRWYARILDELLRPALPEPGGECRMKLRAGELREAGVGDLADEHVLEPKRVLSADRGMGLANEELA
jgi:hypothetical protein